MLVFVSVISFAVVSTTALVTFFAGKETVPEGEKVGVIEIFGVISDATKVIGHLKTFREDAAVKAIVLRIDSPGGGVGPSQEIYREIQKTRKVKKVVSSLGSVAASGGYYAASATDSIMANPGTITGSIGVIMGYTNFQEVLKKIGLTPVVIKSGDFKDMGSPARIMTEKERGILQGFVDKIHRQFVGDAARGRNMEREEMARLADGRIYTGEEAVELGLVDRLGNLEDAIEYAGRLGGISGKISPLYPEEEKLSILRQLAEASLGEFVRILVKPSMEANYIME